MPIGDGNSNSNNNNNKNYDPTYYSRIRFSNSEDKKINITFRSGLLIIEICTVDSNDGYKIVPIQTMHLSPIKSNMLVKQMDNFLQYITSSKKIEENVAFGVNGGINSKVSYIGFSSNSDKEIIMTIGKFDENGQITESTQYKFSKNYNYALNWKDISCNDLSKEYMDFIEFSMLKNLIEDFGRSMSGAYGYASADINRYETAKNNRKIDSIMDKLGIERPRYNNNSRSENNFLSNASSKSTSIDNVVEDLLG